MAERTIAPSTTESRGRYANNASPSVGLAIRSPPRTGSSAAALSSGDHWQSQTARKIGPLKSRGRRNQPSRVITNVKSTIPTPAKTAPACHGFSGANGMAATAAGRGYRSRSLNGYTPVAWITAYGLWPSIIILAARQGHVKSNARPRASTRPRTRINEHAMSPVTVETRHRSRSRGWPGLLFMLCHS